MSQPSDTSCALNTLACPSFVRHDEARYLYAFGNTKPEDWSLHHSRDSERIRLLSVGCGDLRSLLFTIAETGRRGDKWRIEATLNDWQPEVIARNALIVFSLATEKGAVKPEWLLQLWYSLRMSDEAHAFWMGQIRNCIEAKEPYPLFSFTDEVTRGKVVHVWRSWLACDWTNKRMDRERTKFLEAQTMYQKSGGAVGLAKAHADLFFVNESTEVKRRLTAEMHFALKMGCLLEGSRLNPTLLLVNRNGTFIYALHYGTHPFEGIHPIPMRTLTDSLLFHVSDWISGFLNALPRISSIAFNTSHVLHFLDVLISQSARYDVIDTSNLADVVGMLNLLASCSPLLAIPGKSLLKACTFLHCSFAANRLEYLIMVTGLPVEAYSTLLGLALPSADPDDWVSYTQPFGWSFVQYLPELEGRNLELYTFVKAFLPEVPVSLSGSPFLTDAIMSCAGATVCSSFAKVDVPGGCNATPQTLAKLIAFAFAEQRISVSSKRNTFPLPDPEELWQQIYDTVGFKGSMAEFYAYLNAFGFRIRNIIESCTGLPPFIVSHEFPAPVDSMGGTPCLLLGVEDTGGPPCSHWLESLDVELNGNRVKITALVPGFFVNCKPSNVKLTMCTKEHTNGILPVLTPCGEQIPLTKCRVTRRPSHIRQSLTSAILQSTTTPQASTFFPVESVLETQKGYEVKLLFSEQTKAAKLTLGGAGKSFLIIDDSRERHFQLPSPVEIVNVKIHRKSGFVILLMKKRAMQVPPPVLSLKGLPKVDDYVGLPIATMYQGKEAETKRAQKSGPSSFAGFSSAEITVYEMKDNLQILFEYAKTKVSIAGISVNQDTIALLFIHGLYSMPPVSAANGATPLLDVSVLFGDPKNVAHVAIFKRVFGSRPLSVINIEQRELEPLKELFRRYGECSGSLGVHKEVRKVGGEKWFQRVVVHPLYPTEAVRFEVSPGMKRKREAFQRGRREVKGALELMQGLSLQSS